MKFCEAWFLFVSSFSVASLVLTEAALVLAELLLLLRDCEEATTVPRGLVVLRATTLALVLPLRVVPLLVGLLDDDDAGAAAPELLRLCCSVGVVVEDTETEQQQRKEKKIVQSK